MLSDDQTLMCTHGILMISAWQMTASIGLLVSRFYKPAWPTRQLFSTQIWFTIHRLCMVLTLLLTVAGFIVIFVDDQSYVGNTEPVGYQQAHPAIGIVVTALVIINPIMAVFRCAPEDSRRPWFNWFHFYVGYIAYILAAINIFFGLGLYFSQSAYIPSIWWLVGASMAFHLFSEAVLKTHSDLRTWQLAYRQKECQRHIPQPAAAAAEKDSLAVASPQKIESGQKESTIDADRISLGQLADQHSDVQCTTDRRPTGLVLSYGYENMAATTDSDVKGRDLYQISFNGQKGQWSTGNGMQCNGAKSSDDKEMFTAMDYRFLHAYLLVYTTVVIGLWIAIVVVLAINII